MVGIIERVVSTFLQAFIAALLATSQGAMQSHVDWANAFWIGVFAAFVAVLTSLGAQLTKLKDRLDAKPLADLIYRAVATFVQTLTGLALAAGSMSALTFDWDTALKSSAIAAGTALLKALSGYSAAHTMGASVFDKVGPAPAANPAPPAPAAA